ncbi:MAG: LysM peptidoglycan-binding domain-containing protein [Meiothermus sp.]|nr:LysM peptidoglycan-binding domain-containing protein [Meiothermus sp.]
MRIIALLVWFFASVMAQTPTDAGRVPQTPAAASSHTVQQGDTLFSIARRYSTTVEVIQRLNGLEGTALRLGQVLRLPLPVVQHTVQRGDTLFSIARRYGSNVEAIRTENKLVGNTLSLGQVLRIPQTTLTQAAQPTAPAKPPTPQPQPAAPVAPSPQPVPQAVNTPPPGGSNVNLVRPAALPNTPVPASAQPVAQPRLEATQPAQPPASAPTQPQQPPPPPPVAPSPPPASTQAADTDYDPNSPLIPVVLRYLGLPYVYGANSDRAVDCSAFVQQVFSELGVRVPRTSREQFAAFPAVTGAMRQGDLVFFSFGGSQIDHVGIYLGRGVFAHANSYGSRVVIESLDSPYYRKVFRGAKRVEVQLTGK